MPHKILSPAAICLPCQREVAAPPARPEGLPRPQMPPAETPHFVGADSISARGRPHRRKVCGTMQASSPTEVCYNAWPRPSRPARNIKFIRRGGIHPARERLRRRRPPVRAGPKTRTEQAPLSKGARAEIGGLPPPGKLPPPGPRQNALPSANGILRRNNPSVLASLGRLPLTREAKTALTAANRADMVSAPTGVCYNAWPRPSRSPKT